MKSETIQLGEVVFWNGIFQSPDHYTMKDGIPHLNTPRKIYSRLRKELVDIRDENQEVAVLDLASKTYRVFTGDKVRVKEDLDE